jgi:hypothetical protein
VPSALEPAHFTASRRAVLSALQKGTSLQSKLILGYAQGTCRAKLCSSFRFAERNLCALHKVPCRWHWNLLNSREMCVLAKPERFSGKAENMHKLISIVKPYMHQKMVYKFGPYRSQFNEKYLFSFIYI